MKRVIFTILVALTYILAQAQWGYAPTEARLINADNEYFYTYDVAQTQEGNTWLYMRTEYDRHFVQLYDSTGGRYWVMAKCCLFPTISNP